MEFEKTCFFTGHRHLPADKIEHITAITKSAVEFLIVKKNVHTFLCGGALGFDLLCGNLVSNLKKEYPHICLILYLPCYGQSKPWAMEDKYYFHLLKSKADEIRYITEKSYTSDCMKKRNHAMVEHAKYGICFYQNPRSGTGQTIRYALQHGTTMINIKDKLT